MPELPEVETIVRRLKTKLKGQVVAAVNKLHPKPWQGPDITGRRIIDVSRKAKVIRLDLDNNQAVLIHLKMTGQLIYIGADQKRHGGGHPTNDFLGQLPAKHTRIFLDFADGSQLFFNDQRVFGWWHVVDAKMADRELSVFGPDIVSEQLTPQYLKDKWQKKTTAIKLALLDSAVIAGLGNIYVCDGLHLAGINPWKPACSLKKTEIENLLSAMKQVVNLGIELGGATIKDYRTADGLSGGYQNHIRVYGKENEKCEICETIISRKKQGGRSTFYCAKCQNVT